MNKSPVHLPKQEASAAEGVVGNDHCPINNDDNNVSRGAFLWNDPGMIRIRMSDPKSLSTW